MLLMDLVSNKVDGGSPNKKALVRACRKARSGAWGSRADRVQGNPSARCVHLHYRVVGL